jgi:hypothetical protein
VKRLASIALMFLIFAPVAAMAQSSYLSEWWNPEALAQWVFPGMSSDWLRVPQVFYYVIFPFITAFVIIYALLKELRIFRHATNKINGTIAFCFAFLLLPSGILTYIVNIFYAAGAFIGLIAFGALFAVGVVFWAWGRGRGLYYGARVEGEIQKDARDNVKYINEKIRDLRNERSNEFKKKVHDQNKLDQINSKLDKLDEDKKAAVKKLEAIKENV